MPYSTIMFRLLVVASLLVAAYGKVIPAALPSSGGKIVGGENASIRDVPYQAGLILSNQLICGGSILSANVVLSAAHCVIGIDTRFRVRVGNNSAYEPLNDYSQIVGVSKVLIHPQYDGFASDYDFSLFFVVTPLVFGDYVSPITLPSQDQVVADNTLAVTSGWGYLQEGGSAPMLLQKVTIPIVNQEVCESSYSSVGWSVTPRMICAGLIDEGGKDACQGDSGGPLVADGVLIGVTSWGLGCARPGFPGVWARVPAVSDWIKSQL